LLGSAEIQSIQDGILLIETLVVSILLILGDLSVQLMKYSAQQVADVLESIAPRSSGVVGDQLGFIFGEAAADVIGVACVWSVDTQSIANAAKENLNLMITHEHPWIPNQKSEWVVTDDAEPEVNRLRKRMLQEHGITVYRCHSNWDALPQDGVPDQAVAALGIPGLKLVYSEKFFRVHELPKPIGVEDFKNEIENALGYHDCKIYGNSAKRVKKFIFYIGGFGVNQFKLGEIAKKHGVDAVILGEKKELVMLAALDLGISVIETLHSVSEIPAIRRQAEMLSEKLKGLRVVYIPSGALAFSNEKS
jgi:putative NIF3 family GTP cyclohydrolase 1 type 2